MIWRCVRRSRRARGEGADGDRFFKEGAVTLGGRGPAYCEGGLGVLQATAGVGDVRNPAKGGPSVGTARDSSDANASFVSLPLPPLYSNSLINLSPPMDDFKISFQRPFLSLSNLPPPARRNRPSSQPSLPNSSSTSRSSASSSSAPRPPSRRRTIASGSRTPSEEFASRGSRPSRGTWRRSPCRATRDARCC